MARSTQPPEHSTALVWLRNQGHASTLALLARSYLQTADTRGIEHLLRRGRHGRAVTRFCERFSQRCFPLDYPWTGDADGRLLAEVAGGIQHEGFGDDWEEYGDLWSLRPVFLLSWGLLEDPYAPMRDEFLQDEVDGKDRAEYRLCDQAREIVARCADVPVAELFQDVPVDGFPAGHLRMRLQGTPWEPLLWAEPWLWRLSGNAFLDQSPSEGAEPQPWLESTVFRLSAEFREAVRLMHAIDAFDNWLCQAPAERARAAVQAASGPPSELCRPWSICPWSDANEVCVDGSARTLERRASMPKPPQSQKPFTGYRLEAAGESARSVLAALSATHPRLQVLATSSRAVAVAEADAAMLYDAIDAAVREGSALFPVRFRPIRCARGRALPFEAVALSPDEVLYLVHEGFFGAARGREAAIAAVQACGALPVPAMGLPPLQRGSTVIAAERHVDTLIEREPELHLTTRRPGGRSR